MKNKLIFPIILTLFLTCFTSCKKEQIFTVHTRVPQKMEFAKRTLPENYVIGAKRPEGLEAIDLGLSVKWANMNLGASAPEESGEFYRWAEIEPFLGNGLSWDVYEHYEYGEFHTDDPYTSYLTKYCFDRYGERQDVEPGASLDDYDDAAYLQWGEGYRIPTAAELEELASCTWTYDEDSELYTITGPNGNSIVLNLAPSATMEDGSLWSNELWTVQSTHAISLSIKHDNKNKVTSIVIPIGRNNWCEIRPVFTN